MSDVRERRGGVTALLLFLLCCCQASNTDSTPARLLVLGDTQRTSVPERLLGREQNDEERVLLIRHAAAEQVEVMVHLGDMVFDGNSAEQWRRFDTLIAPLHRAGIAILPVLGNHEYWGGYEGIAHVEDRFPAIRGGRWFATRFHDLGLILLDSNQRPLGFACWELQREWYEEQLRAFDADPAVRGVLVFVHHPPFTNSTVTPDEVHVQQAFLPGFLRARKTLAMISGHAHAYEHFVEEGKHFIVSGGGGGPRVELLAGARRRHQDLYRGPSPRPFHFLLLEIGAEGVRVQVKGFEKGSRELAVLDAFLLAFQPIDSKRWVPVPAL